MTIFTVHVPHDPVDARQAADRTRIVPDVFSWGAFLLGPIWLLWNRLWLALIGWVVIAAAVGGLGAAGRLPTIAEFGCWLLLQWALGVEGNGFLAAALRRRGLALTAVLAARDAHTAEAAFFNRMLAASTAAASAAKPASAAATGRDEFVGLSPDAGG
ncbi:MAG TPA: DUF2628 domain-containing protein [Beijerinckiaceae bacterium]|jgi:hypothetical protein|nr:DUF2628 domain-containing protein [Beijerinckiaceae bacterium]